MIYIRRLRWDDWNVAHIALHDVTPEEVEEVCHGDFFLLQGKKRRIILSGPMDAVRVLAVVHEGDYYPVTARSASRKERRWYLDRKKEMKGAMAQQTQQKGRIPEFASREEEAQFWDTHDITDYLDEFEVVNRRDVSVEENLSEGITVRLTPELLHQLRKTAKKKGIGPSTLARMWIIEQLRETTE